MQIIEAIHDPFNYTLFFVFYSFLRDYTYVSEIELRMRIAYIIPSADANTYIIFVARTIDKRYSVNFRWIDFLLIAFVKLISNLKF